MLKNFLFPGSILLTITSWLPVKSGDDDKAIFTRKYAYETLSPYQKQLFEDFLADELPAGKKVFDVPTNHTSLRNKTRLAEAFLFRNKPGDKENAAEILTWILKNQYRDAEKNPYRKSRFGPL